MKAKATSSSSSSADIAKQIQKLLQPHSDERTDASRLDELRRVLAKLVQAGELFGKQLSAKKQTLSPALRKWRQFLEHSHKNMVLQLCDRIRMGRRTAVRTLWGVVAATPRVSASGNNVICTSLLEQWLRATMAIPEFDKSVHSMVQGEFLGPFRDVQYYALVAIANVADGLYNNFKDNNKNDSSKDDGDDKEEAKDDDDDDDTEQRKEQAGRLLQILMMVPVATSQAELDDANLNLLFPPAKHAVPEVAEDDSDSDSDDDSDDSDNSGSSSDSDNDEQQQQASPKKKQKVEPQRKFAYATIRLQRRAWSRAWLSVLRLPMTPLGLRRALQFLPDSVLNNVSHPLRFADFFVQAYSQGGVCSVLALDGLFLLVTKHGLEYQDFYKQLYKLVVPKLFSVRYRTRFLRLLTKCLALNEMLPAHIVAAFVKRLMRCSLMAPPPGILYCLALTSNLLRKHPETLCLVHREKATPMADPFDAVTDDPEQAQALQSSLWELQALSRHYLPAVAILARSVGLPEERNTPLHNMEDFLTHTYKSLFEQERKRRRQKTPALTFAKPTGLFAKDDVFAGFLRTTSTVEE